MLFSSVFLLGSALSVCVCGAENREECATALALLLVAEHTAADAVQKVESARQQVNSKWEELEYCRRFPDIHNVSPDNCDTLRWAYESLKADYARSQSELGNRLIRLAVIISVVHAACGAEVDED